MSAQDQGSRSAWSRNRWWLPVLLAVLIAALVVGVVFGGRIKKAVLGATPTPTSLPTATATPVVVTATPAVTYGPGTPSPTPVVGGASTATPSAQGASTPLPGATPFPTIPGVQVGMVSRPAAQVQALQAGADRKDPKYTYYLNPVLVVQKNLPHYGFTNGFQYLQPPATPTPVPTRDQLNRPLVRTYVMYSSRKFEVDVAQPGRQGPTGIWVIITIKQLS